MSGTLTNDLGLPTPLVEAVRRDSYDKGDCDFSVTQLIAPARIAQLRKQHADALTEDVSDRIFSLIGQAIHTILERAAGDRYLVEERFFVRHSDGTRLSGRIDLFDLATKTLQDWKVTSRYATAEGPKPDWIAQGNLNKFLMENNGHEVKRIEYVAIYRDWSKMAVARGVKDYPQKQVEIISLPIWSPQKTESFLAERISAHRQAEAQLPLCSDEERWYRPPKWALMQKKRKRALKLFATEGEAAGAITDAKIQYVEARKSEHTRCLYFCDVSNYCSQFRELMTLV